MTITCKKDGTVLSDGNLVGTVEKVVHDGLWAGKYGVRAGGTEWIATAPDGTKFEANETRKDAAKMLARHAEPLSVTNVHVEDHMGRKFVYAAVSWQGHTALVSRYPGETAWIVDAYYTPGSFMPAWSNGSGTRYTRAHVLKAEQAAAADAALAESGIDLSNLD